MKIRQIFKDNYNRLIKDNKQIEVMRQELLNSVPKDIQPNPFAGMEITILSSVVREFSPDYVDYNSNDRDILIKEYNRFICLHIHKHRPKAITTDNSRWCPYEHYYSKDIRTKRICTECDVTQAYISHDIT
jgi:hypothetical protein